MKKLLEILVCLVLHPVAVVLAWINLAGRHDLGLLRKILWAVLMIIPVVPIFYVLLSGELW